MTSAGLGEDAPPVDELPVDLATVHVFLRASARGGPGDNPEPVNPATRPVGPT